MKEDIKRICKFCNIKYDDNLSEEFIKTFSSGIDWNYISAHQRLSEEFIEKFTHKVNWDYISIHQKLSEEFIEKHKDEVYWRYISQYQKLSEGFIEKHKDEVYWDYISSQQKLSEEFIEKHADRVNWRYISTYQKLSEKFIEKHADKVGWDFISKYQKLSEGFTEKFKYSVNWYFIFKYQILSTEFIKRHDLSISKSNWAYKSKEYKLDYIRKNTNYEVINDEYVIAYKSVRINNYSVFNFQYMYEVGGIYEAHCDCNIAEENSFGLSAWTKQGALEYYSRGKLLKVKIMIEDIGAIVQDNKKIRCRKFEILEEVE